MPNLSLARELDERFPSKEKPIGRPLNPGQAVENARRGDDCASIPWMLRDNAATYNGMVRNRLDNGFDLSKEEHRQEYRKVLIASGESQKAADELAAYRTFQITNDVMASPFAMGPFLTQNLAPDEMPMIERPRSRNLQRFTVRSVGIEGGHRQDQWMSTKSVADYQLDVIGTDRINYPLMDIQNGDISQSEAINTELRYDMEMKIDSLARANIDAAAATSGLRALLSLHPSVVAANIPDANSFDLNAEFAGNDDVLTIQKMKYILNHIALLQSVGGPLAGLTISTIMCSPQNMRDSWDFIDLVSGVAANEPVLPAKTVTTPVREQIFQNGMFTSAWGYNWSWTPNSQIAKGKMYVFMNQPIGWMFTKTHLDRTLVWNESNSPDHAEANMGETLMRRCLSFVCPDVWKYRILVIDL